MADQEHLDILWQGVDVWNKWREEHPHIKPDLKRAKLRRANLSEANLSEVDFRRANLREADLSETNLIGADLSYTNLIDANLTGATFKGVISVDTNRAGSYYRKTYGSGIPAGKFHKRWPPSVDERRATTESANLSKAKLQAANLCGVDLSEIDLSGAYLLDTDLTRVNLRETNLCEADLTGASLIEADLTEADLSGANLSEVIVYATIFAGLDLRDVKGLNEIEHRGPSFVALDTVQLPQDGSALHFLRGVGVSDEWISFYHAQMMYPIQYYSCFISYSSHDEILAKRLCADLQDQGVRCWFAQEDMKIGDKIRVRIDEAIHLQDKLLLLLSEHAIASPWVEDEVEAALEKEQRQQREVLFPIRLDESVMQTSQAWAAKLRRTRHIGDFTYWTDPQVYQQSFERLLRDLKAQP